MDIATKEVIDATRQTNSGTGKGLVGATGQRIDQLLFGRRAGDAMMA